MLHRYPQNSVAPLADSDGAAERIRMKRTRSQTSAAVALAPTISWRVKTTFYWTLILARRCGKLLLVPKGFAKLLLLHRGGWNTACIPTSLPLIPGHSALEKWTNIPAEGASHWPGKGDRLSKLVCVWICEMILGFHVCRYRILVRFDIWHLI